MLFVAEALFMSCLNFSGKEVCVLNVSYHPVHLGSGENSAKYFNSV